jgi:hypothetical protein
MATRVTDKMPGYDQDVPVTEVDKTLLERAKTLYDERGNGLQKSNKPKASGQASWQGYGHQKSSYGSHSAKPAWGKRPYDQSWGNNQAKRGRYCARESIRTNHEQIKEIVYIYIHIHIHAPRRRLGQEVRSAIASREAWQAVEPWCWLLSLGGRCAIFGC